MPRKGRRKKAVPREWHRNIEKMKIQTGQEHQTRSCNVRQAKSCKQNDCTKCARKCSYNFSEDDLMEINMSYWILADIKKQRQYLNSLIIETDKAVVRTKETISRRQKTRQFYVVKDNKRIQICQKDDKRGKHTSRLKRPKSSRKIIMQHINSFPRVPYHYSRRYTQKEYIAPDLNIFKMYEIYIDKYESENIIPERKWFYRNILHQNFILSFHTPRKDNCDKCYKFEKLKDEDKKRKSKKCARYMKDDFKTIAQNGKRQFIRFDIESAIFYKLRLSVYYTTIYDVATWKAVNNMWHEVVAGRGSIEVASCLFDFIMNSSVNGQECVLMSNTCGGQNHNAILATMCLYTVQMECDTVHDHIETASENIEIYDSSGWHAVSRLASKDRKCEIKEIYNSMILDFKSMQTDVLKNENLM
ncbi:hypothetical protein PR048_005244 [Dryococelus australis]|uniref:Polyprotein n=1 Tax=Dryococelus australis TaxID=614101 RepID=A0ABQ9I7M8_9NEOP|nr:hypothetical protein PR048_005244 [Dryococelus australis]